MITNVIIYITLSVFLIISILSYLLIVDNLDYKNINVGYISCNKEFFITFPTTITINVIIIFSIINIFNKDDNKKEKYISIFVWLFGLTTYILRLLINIKTMIKLKDNSLNEIDINIKFEKKGLIIIISLYVIIPLTILTIKYFYKKISLFIISRKKVVNTNNESALFV